MRLLDRYLLRELAVPLAYCLAGFLMFWISFDLFSDLDEFQREKLQVADIALYYLIRTPELMVTVMPVALLLALLYSLTNHARHNEIVAMRAAGQSLIRICMPYLGVGFVFSLLLFYLNERLVPDSMQMAQQVRKRGQPEVQVNKAWRNNVNFRNSRDSRFWHIGAYNLDTTEMHDVHVDWDYPDGSSRTVIAKSGIRTNDQWVFSDAELSQHDPKVEVEKAPRSMRTNQIAFPDLGETPAEIKLLIRFHSLSAYDASKRSQLSLQEINYLRLHLELNAHDRALLETQFHARLAEPWKCLVVVFLAAPFSAASGRRNVFVGVTSSIFIVFGYFILSRFGLAFGNGGYIPPWLAAWLPNVCFLSIGLWLGIRVR